MKHNFWQQLNKPFFVLAPMEDVTDIVFRHVIASAARPDVFFTEFTNTESFNHPEGRQSTQARLLFTDDEQPMVAHIWGDVPEYFANMSIELAKMGFSGIDINMGCPAPNVFKHGRGAGLILRPQRAAEIIQAAKTGGLPVSVKTRLGHTYPQEYETWLAHLLQQDLANLTVHLRTKTEMSKVAAHYELIPAIKTLRDTLAPKTTLTINGDIADRATGLRLAKQTGVDGIMIGRGVFHNPFAFAPVDTQYTRDDLLQLMLYHMDLYDQYIRPDRSFRPLHRFFKIYVKDFDGASDLRVKLMETNNTDEVRALIRPLIQNQPSK